MRNGMTRLVRFTVMLGIAWALLAAPAATESPVLFGILNQQTRRSRPSGGTPSSITSRP
jgi:hypothetical protein